MKSTSTTTISGASPCREGEAENLAANPKERSPHARARPQPEALASCRRCGAKARSGNPCQAPAVKGRKRCRLHGGAKGSGAPKGEANGAFRHGGYTPEAIEQRRKSAALLRTVRGGEAPRVDLDALAALLAFLGVNETRAQRSERNKARWRNGDRREWGGEDRRRWPKRSGRNGYGR